MVSVQLVVASFALWVAALVDANAQGATNSTHVRRHLNNDFNCIVAGHNGRPPKQSLEIDMTNGLEFMKTMQTARTKIKAVQGLKDESSRKKKSADGVNCYATTGWDITIKRSNSLKKTFGMLNNVYIEFRSGYKEQYEVPDPWYWSTDAFDEMLGWTESSAPLGSETVAMLYTIGEALRFDWVRNRIAHILKAAKNNEFGMFALPHAALLTKWDAGFNMRLPVMESEATEWIAGQQWHEDWVGIEQPCSFLDDSAISILTKAEGNGKCTPALVNEVKQLLVTAIRDRIAAMQKAGGDPAKISALEAEITRFT